MTKKKWFEVLTPKQLIHWVPAGRSGACYHALFPDLPIAKANMPKRIWKLRKSRMAMVRLSRRANR